MRAIEAAHRRQERDAKKRERELAKLVKERAKMSLLEQAQLEVAEYENRIETLLSIHKDCGKAWEWKEVAASLRDPEPVQDFRKESEAIRRLNFENSTDEERQATVESAKMQDQEDFRNRLREYEERNSETEDLRRLAQRILAGEEAAYREAIEEINPFEEIGEFGSSVHFVIHDENTVECTMKVKGGEAIPGEHKTLSSTGKVSTRAMPKGKRHEIYQDYVCGCVLRLAREIFALLPVEHTLISAVVGDIESNTGQLQEKTVLSVIIPRQVLCILNFSELDPSDSMENFQRRGDLKKSKRTEVFEGIEALKISDLKIERSDGLAGMIKSLRLLREEIETISENQFA